VVKAVEVRVLFWAPDGSLDILKEDAAGRLPARSFFTIDGEAVV
jgi:hypothetical protein